MPIRSASTQSRSSGMNRFNALCAFMGSITILYTYIAGEQEHKNYLRKRDEKRAERKACMAMGFNTFTNTYMRNYDARDSTLDGDHPKQNLVKGRKTVEDNSCWRCEFLSKKHEECAKLHGSDELLCNAKKIFPERLCNFGWSISIFRLRSNADEPCSMLRAPLTKRFFI